MNNWVNEGNEGNEGSDGEKIIANERFQLDPLVCFIFPPANIVKKMRVDDLLESWHSVAEKNQLDFLTEGACRIAALSYIISGFLNCAVDNGLKRSDVWKILCKHIEDEFWFQNQN